MVGLIFFYLFHPGDEFPPVDFHIHPAGDLYIGGPADDLLGREHSGNAIPSFQDRQRAQGLEFSLASFCPLAQKAQLRTQGHRHLPGEMGYAMGLLGHPSSWVQVDETIPP